MLEQTPRNNRRNTLTGLLLPLSDRSLVLPNVAVAELIGYQPCTPLPHQPAWLLGWIDWRSQRLPLLSFEAACGGRAHGKPGPGGLTPACRGPGRA